MKHEKVGGRNHCKRLMLKLMDHRKIDVYNFAELVFEELQKWSEWDDEKHRLFRRWFDDLRDDLEDIDCAILDVLLADSLEDAESIVEAFHANMTKG